MLLSPDLRQLYLIRPGQMVKSCPQDAMGQVSNRSLQDHVKNNFIECNGCNPVKISFMMHQKISSLITLVDFAVRKKGSGVMM